MEHRAFSRLRFSSYKLPTVTGKWCNTEKQKQIFKLCPGSAIENEILVLLNCPLHKNLRDKLFLGILKTYKFSLSCRNFRKTKNPIHTRVLKNRDYIRKTIYISRTTFKE